MTRLIGKLSCCYVLFGGSGFGFVRIVERKQTVQPARLASPLRQSASLTTYKRSRLSSGAVVVF